VTVRTVGVEEEFLLADVEHARIVSAAPRVLGEGHDGLEAELTRQQVETGTEPVGSLDELRSELARMRRMAAEAAAAEGATLLALGTAPVEVTPQTTTKERYLRMVEEFGEIGREQLTCGCHIHVGVESRDEAVGVLDRLRTWLPCLMAIAGNSPYWHGQDTGYSSYRAQVWDRWPSAGATAAFGSAAAYDELVDGLIQTGVVLDRGMIYFDARPSEKYSTLEIRVPDVCLSVDDAVLVAALARGLVTIAAAAWERGEPVQEARPELLRVARWRASRSGLDGVLVDLDTGCPVPARALLGRLVEHVCPALEDAGDVEVVREGLDQVLRRGTGARRQRETCERVGAGGLLAYAAEETLGGC
jgi:carboxylate-amine ligase